MRGAEGRDARLARPPNYPTPAISESHVCRCDSQYTIADGRAGRPSLDPRGERAVNKKTLPSQWDVPAAVTTFPDGKFVEWCMRRNSPCR